MSENFVKTMEEYHELQVHFEEMGLLFDSVSDKEMDEFYYHSENEKLIKRFNL